jgi:tetratricopeptide (TPR) repeat protein
MDISKKSDHHIKKNLGYLLEKPNSQSIEYIDQLLMPEVWQDAHPLLQDIPKDIRLKNAAILCIQGLIYKNKRQITKAIYFLQKGQTIATLTNQSEVATKCSLELAYIYLHKESFKTASHHIKAVSNQSKSIQNKNLKAQFFLRLAELYPDIGNLYKSTEYAQKAYYLFQQTGKTDDQIQSAWLLAIVHTQLGHYQEAEPWLSIAKSILQDTNKSFPQIYGKLNSAEAHLNWYRGHLAKAIKQAHHLKDFADNTIKGKRRIYVRMLLANLYRAIGEYQTAQHLYAEARQITQKMDLSNYSPWIDAQESWLATLTNNFPKARELIYQALETLDSGQVASFNIFLAGLNLLSNQYQPTERALLQSRSFYQKSGDELTVQVINIYLAYLYRKLNRNDQAGTCLEEAFGWFSERNIDYFPHWWHPMIVSNVCEYALITNIYPDIAKRFLSKRLDQEEVIKLLRNLLHHKKSSVRREAYETIKLIKGDLTDELENVVDGSAKIILEHLLTTGQFRKDGFASLKKKLVTAQKRQLFNPTLVAVFGLYLQNLRRSEIASKLQRSEGSIHKYITTIYQIFDIPKKEFKSSKQRKAKLRERAKEEGFI